MGVDITVGLAILVGGAALVAIGGLLSRAVAYYVLRGIREDLETDLSSALARAIREVQQGLEDKLEGISDRLDTSDFDRRRIWETLEHHGLDRRTG